MALVKQSWHLLRPRGSVVHLIYFVDGGPRQVCTWASVDVWGAFEDPKTHPRCWRCENRPHPKALEWTP